jgi:hypothetical protein
MSDKAVVVAKMFGMIHSTMENKLPLCLELKDCALLWSPRHIDATSLNAIDEGHVLGSHVLVLTAVPSPELLAIYGIPFPVQFCEQATGRPSSLEEVVDMASELMSKRNQPRKVELGMRRIAAPPSRNKRRKK